MKILSAPAIRALDQFTIENEPIASIDLMERAAKVFSDWFAERFSEDKKVVIFCGTGNNGGDGLAVARRLSERFYSVQVFICRFSSPETGDFQTNLERLKKNRAVPIFELTANDLLPHLSDDVIVVDAILGSGLNKPADGFLASLLSLLNKHAGDRVSIDIPSGMFADRHTEGTSFHATHTLSFELPKLGFLFSENQDRVGLWEVRPIGLSPGFIEQVETKEIFIDQSLVAPLIRPRHKFDHKGVFGHALLIAGSYGKIGAAILAAKACLRSGCGLVTVHVPKCGYEILQISFPEAMVSIDQHQFCFNEAPNLKPFQAVGIGCGIGTNRMTEMGFASFLEIVTHPLVIDADGLNILGNNKHLLSKLPKASILTPHPKEFERVFGLTNDDFERHELQREMSVKYGIIIILKTAHSCISTPNGHCYFNSTGNPGMATGGSGDVLTGMLTGLLAQGYAAQDAAILGVYLHGLAGDLALAASGQESLLASDIIEHIGHAFCKTENIEPHQRDSSRK